MISTSSQCSPNERQLSVNDFRPCILENQRAVRHNCSIIELSAAFLVKTAWDKIVTMYQNERQRSVNNFWSCILDNLTAIERRIPTISLSAAFNGKNASDDIASASYNWVPTEHQQFLWRLRTLFSNVLHCAAPKSSFTRSVFAICPCIQLHKYACNVLQIWFYCCSCIQYLRTRSLLYFNDTFGSLSSRITHHSKFYHHVGFTIFEHLLARGYDLLQKRRCLYSWFERPYFANHLRCVVGFNEYRLKAADCLE